MEEEVANGGDKLQNRGGGEGGEGVMATEGGGDLSSINAMMSAVMSAAGILNGGRNDDGESGVTSANSSAGPSPSPSPSKALTSAMRAPRSRNARRKQDTKDDSCPLCDKSCQTQHQLTMHIRQHNADTGATDHSCSICGKCLSSASSLDRHMLVHSGERPYKCTICGQTFTTSSNMHRHMKIHEKDPASGLLPVGPPSPTKRRRPSIKRRKSPDEENMEEPPSKKMVEDAGSEEPSAMVRGGEEELLPCPICFKTCSSRLELDAHMDTHPDTALRRRCRKKPAALAAKEKTAVSKGIDLESSGEFASVEKMLAKTDANKFSNYLQPGAADLGAKRDVDREDKEGGARDEAKPAAAAPQAKGKKKKRCDVCCLSFRTHRGLLCHNARVHKLLPQDPSGRPFIQNNPSIPTGFDDLKFAHIAQVWCDQTWSV